MAKDIHDEIEDLIDRGELEEALRLVEGALREDPDDYDLNLYYADILEALGKNEEAVEVYERMYDLYGDADLLLVEADLLSRTGRNEEALKVVERAERDHPYDRDVKIMKALVLANMDEFGRAREILERLMEQFPEDPEVRLYYGTILIDEGKEVERGVEILLPLREDDPENPYVWFNLGVGLFKMGDHASAAEAFEKADALFGGEDPDSVYWLAVSLKSIGDEKTPKKLAERLLEMGAVDLYEEISKILEKG